MEARPRWSSRTKLTVSLLLTALGVFLLYRFQAAIQPMILAMILAYVMTPVVNFLQKKLKLRRALAALLAILGLLISIVALVMLVLPTLTAQSAGLNQGIGRFVVQAETLLGQRFVIAGQAFQIDGFLRDLEGSIQTLLEPIIGQSFSLMIDLLSSLVWVIFIVVVSFYLVKDGALLSAWMESLVPPLYRPDYLIMQAETSRIWSSFFRGQLILALVVAGIFSVVGLAIGLPYALAMAVLAGLLEFLPSLGHGIWLGIASLLALFAGSTWLPIPSVAFMLIVVALHVIFQQFDLNYLIPRIIGRSVHLPPLVVILGIVTGALLAGVLGVLLAAPVIASARVLGRYIYANLFDMDPFPGSISTPLPPPNPRWWRKPPLAEKNKTD